MAHNMKIIVHTICRLEKVCTDTTMFYNRGRPYDLTLYLDAFNNEIAAYDLAFSKHGSGTENHFSALKKLLKAIKKRVEDGILFLCNIVS